MALISTYCRNLKNPRHRLLYAREHFGGRRHLGRSQECCVTEQNRICVGPSDIYAQS